MVEKIMKWCNQNSLEISTLKTKVIFWSTTRENKHPKSIKLDGHKIEISKTVKYLGITIDNKLKWNDHIENVVKKSKKALFATKRAIGSKWGISPQQMLWIYKTIIIPIISYGSIVWAMNLTKSQIAKITPIQTMAQHMITRCKTSTPKVLLNLLLNMAPIELKLEETALKRALTLKTERHWNMNNYKNEKIQSTQEIIDWKLKNVIKIDPNPISDKISPFSILNKTYKINIENRDSIQVKECESNLLIFTDGSKNEKGNTGIGITFSEEEINEVAEPLPTHTSIYQAEAIAIWKASEIIRNKNLSNLNIEFYSDSQAVLKSLMNKHTKNELIKMCHNSLNELGGNNTVNLNWIPGHEGHEGNEIADYLAKKGSLKQVSNPLYNKAPFTTFINIINKHYHRSIENRFIYSDISCEAKILTSGLVKAYKYRTNKMTNKILTLNYEKISTLIKILSNHNNLNYHMTKTKQSYNEHCEYCTEVMKYVDYNWEENCLETAHHILCKCSYFSNKRKEIFNKYQFDSIDDLQSSHLINKMIKFFNNTNIFETKPQITKRSLSPNRTLSHKTNKRRSTPTQGNNNKRRRYTS